MLGVDDTSVRLQDPSLPGKMRTARFWLYRGRGHHPYNVFDFTESRGRDGPAEFLHDWIYAITSNTPNGPATVISICSDR